MQVKRYIGKDTQEIMVKVKGELGHDAIILHTRKIYRRGIKRLYSKPLVEMVVAVDNEAALNNTPIKASSPAGERNEKHDLKYAHLEERVTFIDRVMKEYLLGDNKESLSDRTRYTPEVEDIYQILLDNDVTQQNGSKIADDIEDLLKEKTGEVWETALNIIEGYIGNSIPQYQDKIDRRVIVFTGPTGIGKTTTLAKLAAIYSLQFGKKVGLVTTDTYRISAAEQLKVYADLLNIPLKVVYSIDDIKDTLEVYSDRELILIDTAGKSTNDLGHLEEIQKLVDLCSADETYLVVSATTSHTSCLEIIEGYNHLQNCKLVLTKLDEAKSHGLILNLSMLYDLPIAYITNGQNVPDDIQVANARTLAELILGKKNNLQGGCL